MIRYAPGDQTKAQLLQAYLGGVGRLVEDSSQQGSVRVVLGSDFAGVSAPAGAASGSTAGTGSAATTATTAAAADPGTTPGVTVPVTERGRPLVGCG